MNNKFVLRFKSFAKSEFESLLCVSISCLFVVACTILNISVYLVWFLAGSVTIMVFFRILIKYKIAKNENNERWSGLWLYSLATIAVLGILAGWFGLGVLGLIFGIFLTLLSIASLTIGYVTQKYWIVAIYKFHTLRKSSKNVHCYLSPQRSGKMKFVFFPLFLPVAISSFVISVFKLDFFATPTWVLAAAIPSFVVTILIVFIAWGLRATGIMTVKADSDIIRFEDNWISYFNDFTIESWLAYCLYLIIISGFGIRQEGFLELLASVLAVFLIFGMPYLFISRCYEWFIERSNSENLIRHFSEKYGLKIAVARVSVSETIAINGEQQG